MDEDSREFRMTSTPFPGEQIYLENLTFLGKQISEDKATYYYKLITI